jgi:hypothetical protein
MDDDVLTMSMTYGLAATGQSSGFGLAQSKGPAHATGSAAAMTAAHATRRTARRGPIDLTRERSTTVRDLSIHAGAITAAVASRGIVITPHHAIAPRCSTATVADLSRGAYDLHGDVAIDALA